VFSKIPSAWPSHWKAEGARRLHLVDLNGAAAGKPRNESVIRAILQALGDSRRCKLGGASETWTRSSTISTLGSATIIIGTACGEKSRLPAGRVHGFFRAHHRCARRQGRQVAVEGWSKMTGHDVVDLAKKFQGLWRRGGHLHRYRPRRHADRR